MDRFYDIGKLSIDRKKSLLIDCHAISFAWWVDVLDCSKSWARQRIEMSFEDILAKLKAGSHFVVIDRKFFPFDKEKHFEIGFSTMTGEPSYYLFIWVKDESMPAILKKYGLRELA